MTDRKAAEHSFGIPDKNVLYAAYMSFLQAGGLFIPTKKMFKMGDELNLLISLPQDVEKYHIQGKVAWITPVGAQGNKAGGIGVEFIGGDNENLRTKIEKILAPVINGPEPTHTM